MVNDIVGLLGYVCSSITIQNLGRVNVPVLWNVSSASFNNSLLSPVTMLVHELGHGANHHKNKKEYIQKLNTKNDDYDNLEEKRVIENIETDAAKKHEDIPQNQEKTREDHDGEYYKVEDPTINVNKNGSF